MSPLIVSLTNRLNKLRMLIARNAQTVAEYKAQVAKWGKELYGGQGGDLHRSTILRKLEQAQNSLRSAEDVATNLLREEAELLEQIAQEKARDWINELQRRSKDAWEPWNKRGGWREMLKRAGERVLDAGKRFIRWVRPHPGLILLAVLGVITWAVANKLGDMSGDESVKAGWRMTGGGEETSEPIQSVSLGVDSFAPPALATTEPSADIDLKNLTGDWVTAAFDRDALVTMSLNHFGNTVAGTMSLSGARYGLEEGDYDFSATITEETNSSGAVRLLRFQFTVEKSVFKFEVRPGEIRSLSSYVTRPDGPFLGEPFQVVRRDAPPVGMPPRQD